MKRPPGLLLLASTPLGVCGLTIALAATPLAQPTPGDNTLAGYFQTETAKLSERCLADIQTLEDWKACKATYREQLLEMLGLSPLTEPTDLKAVVTGKVERDQVLVENLHFQSLPGLYVTANLYLPKGLTNRAPTILYLCGHGPVISNNVSYGNKVAYQHHGAWFARNGYVCLIPDSLQLGEIQGLHHGTYRQSLWWWNARGYTPAGVEAWNSIRALDYLATRPEVDTNRFGVTGRSGGGAYSWWLAAIDDRIKVAAPVAGITDLRNHVVDGAVEGHCDCMFTVNTYRWDYPQVAALVAPRPLLLVNTDSDTIFPLDGVLRTHAHLQRLYALHKAPTNLGLVIGPGPHKDTQDLQVPVLRWFNRHLKGDDPVIDTAALKLFPPQELKVFKKLPADARNTNIHASFVPAARTPAVPASIEVWKNQRDAWLRLLTEKTFGGWPAKAGPLELEEKFSAERHGLRFQAYDFTSQPHVRLRLYAVQRAGLRKPERVVLQIAGQASPLSQTNLNAPARSAVQATQGESTLSPDRRDPCPTFAQWLAMMQPGFAKELSAEIAATTLVGPGDTPAFVHLQQHLRTNNAALVWLAPRGIGLTAWYPDPQKQIHIRRRFMLLGQTLDGMRVWDIRRGIQAVRTLKEWRAAPLWLQAESGLACDALYASLFESDVAGLELWRLPTSHQRGPDYLNVLRLLDVPQAVAIVAERHPIHLHQADAQEWDYPVAVGTALRWDRDRLDISR